MINLGNSAIASILLGTTTISKIYLGAEQIYPNATYMWYDYTCETGDYDTTLTRGGDLTVIDSLISKFRRCLARPDGDGGAWITYLDDSDSNYYEDGTAVDYDYTDERYQHYMVHFPKYYYKLESGAGANGEDRLYLSETQIDSDWIEERECLIGVFEAYVYDARLLSVPCNNSGTAFVSEGSLSASTYYTDATNVGDNWGVIDHRAHCTIARMFFAKYGNTDIITEDDDIPCSGVKSTSDTHSMGGTMSMGVAPGWGNSLNRNFLGLEDIVQYKTEFCQGWHVAASGTVVIYDGGFFSSVTGTDEDSYTKAGATNVRFVDASVDAGYILTMSHGTYDDLIPTAVDGSSTTAYASRFVNGTGTVTRGFYRGGQAVNSADAGVSFLRAALSSTVASNVYGARCGFYGDITVLDAETYIEASKIDAIDSYTTYLFRATGENAMANLGSAGADYTRTGTVTTVDTTPFDDDHAIYFNGSALKIHIPAEQFESNALTVDFWIYVPSATRSSGSRNLVGYYDATDSIGPTFLERPSTALSLFSVFTDSETYVNVSGTLDTWQHIALQVDFTVNQTLYIWCNGKSNAAVEITGDFWDYAGLYINYTYASTGSSYAYFYLDEFRISTCARYNPGITFTVPSRRYGT